MSIPNAKALTPNQVCNLIWVVVVRCILDKRANSRRIEWCEMIRHGEYVDWVESLFHEVIQGTLDELEVAGGLVESREATWKYANRHLSLKAFLYFVIQPTVINGLTYTEWEIQMAGDAR